MLFGNMVEASVASNKLTQVSEWSELRSELPEGGVLIIDVL